MFLSCRKPELRSVCVALLLRGSGAMFCRKIRVYCRFALSRAVGQFSARQRASRCLGVQAPFETHLNPFRFSERVRTTRAFGSLFFSVPRVVRHSPKASVSLVVNTLTL